MHGEKLKLPNPQGKLLGKVATLRAPIFSFLRNSVSTSQKRLTVHNNSMELGYFAGNGPLYA